VIIGLILGMSHSISFFLELGVHQQFSAPHVPQQNGVVERRNHTLVEMARTMLGEHRSPRRFWAGAINTVCYISNQIFINNSQPHLCLNKMEL
jgi:transposase InsO family protein